MALRSGIAWRDRLAELWADAWRWLLMAIGLVIGVYLLLDRGLASGALGAAVLAVLVIGAAVTNRVPMAIPLLASPALFVSARAGLAEIDVSVSDVALAAAFGTALLLGRRPYSPPMRALLWLNLLFQFTTLFTVIVNPFTANTVEWFHAWLLISGALIVGWSLGAAGYARRALSLMMLAAGVIALGTFVTAALQFAEGDFSPVYPEWPFPMHKNFAGSVMAFMAIVAYANPDWVGWSREWQRLTFWPLVAAILLTQSRQALLGLVVGVIVVGIRGHVARWSRLVLLLAIPAVILVAISVSEQIESQNRFNSFFQRVDWLREVYALWKHSPWFGHGLRYWYTDTTANFQPPQAEVEVLASAGVVGLAGFVLMWIGIIVVLWRVDRRFGALALAVTLARIVQTQFDLFWVAGQVSIPFAIAGICLGAQAFEQRRVASLLPATAEASAASPREGARQTAPARVGRRHA